MIVIVRHNGVLLVGSGDTVAAHVWPLARVIYGVISDCLANAQADNNCLVSKCR
jgi:hypothetical protein